MDDPAPFERLVQKHFPGCRLLRAWPLSGGISATIYALEMVPSSLSPLPLDAPNKEDRTDPNRRGQGKGPGEGVLPQDAPQPLKIILRQPGQTTLLHNPRAAEDEFTLLQQLQANGLRAPAPLILDTTNEILPFPYLVTEFIEGRPDFSSPQPPEFGIQMASELARVHAIDGSHPSFSFLPRLSERALFQPRSLPANTALGTDHFRDTIEASFPFPDTNPPVLLHGDYWPGNLLWQEGRLVGVIDWEDAALGDPLADLAISRLDLLWIYGREVMETFTHRYLAETSRSTRSLPFWDLWAALRLARLVGTDLEGWAAFFKPYGRDDITPGSIRQYYQYFIQQALD